MIDLFSLEGRTALVTGGSRGIGAAVTAELLRAGARVIIGARSSVGLDTAVADLAELGSVEAVVGDLSSLHGVQALMVAVAGRTDRLDVLVNAGTTRGHSLTDRAETGWDTALDPDIRTQRYLTVAALPLLRAAASAGDPARVINIGAADGLTPSTEDPAYAAGRAALSTLTRQHAERLAAEHILVNAIVPGPFESPAVALAPGSRASAGPVPVRRADRAAEIGGSVVYLASRAGAYTTGTVMVVDGGTTGIGRADALLG